MSCLVFEPWMCQLCLFEIPEVLEDVMEAVFAAVTEEIGWIFLVLDHTDAIPTDNGIDVDIQEIQDLVQDLDIELDVHPPDHP